MIFFLLFIGQIGQNSRFSAGSSVFLLVKLLVKFFVIGQKTRFCAVLRGFCVRSVQTANFLTLFLICQPVDRGPDEV